MSQKKLIYESMKSEQRAQVDIRDYLVFLGATDVAFDLVDEKTCTVSWLFRGETFDLAADATPYIEAWFKIEPWMREPNCRARFTDSLESKLAVINFWYHLRDHWSVTIGPLLYQHSKAFEAAYAQTVLTIQKIRLRSF